MTSRDSFIQECLRCSNQYRLRHGVEALVLNQDLSRLSQQWADKLTMSGTLQHNNNIKFKGENVGENLAYSYNSAKSPTGSSMIDQWYNEVNNYNFNRQGFTSGTGHFTQLVWKDSKEVGFGLGVKNGKHYLVANYYPAGNYYGEFEKNVFKAGSRVSNNSGVDRSGSSQRVFTDVQCTQRHPKSSKKSFFGGIFSKKQKEEVDLDNRKSHASDDFNFTRSETAFDDFNNNNNFLSNDFNHNSQNINQGSKSTTVETKEENGWRIITTTTIEKSLEGTSKQTNIKKEKIY